MTTPRGPTATLDTDTLFTLVDPHGALPFDERRARLVLEQVGLLAHGDVCHVTLDPSPEDEWTCRIDNSTLTPTRPFGS